MQSDKTEINFDDSSDEETLEEGLKDYVLQEQWEAFSKAKGYEKDSDKKLPFLAHAFGIGLLYSQEVNDLYYGKEDEPGLKEKYLSSVVTPDILSDIIDQTLARTLRMFYKDIDDAKIAEVKDVLVLDETLKSLIEKISDALVYIEDGKLKMIDDEGNDFFDLAAQALDEAMEEILSGDDFKDEIDRDFATFYVRGCSAGIPYLESAGILGRNATLSSKRGSPYIVKDKDKDFSAADKANPNFPKETCASLKNAINGQKKLFGEILAGKEATIAQSFFEDCLGNVVIFRNQVRQNLAEAFLFEVRKDLPDAFLSEEINTPAKLLGNLRISNRSATRKMRRLDLTSQFSADSFAEFFEIRVPSSDSRIWNISSVPVRESQLVDDSHSRVDLVFESDAAKGGKYPALYVKLTDFCKSKKTAGIDEKVFARLIKFNLGISGEDDEELKELLKDKQLKQFVAKISYLLFGCEVARNPASLVMHAMMLDLIESGKEDGRIF